ncbi:helicase-related protein [Candidatus Amarolinea dominans]|uniref:helicase-related protein n=1 Tax=Candidatus Amarolinea dominans TaxID=3140696 RepID=UPI003135AF30|nr:hypothetical protein [Anaerolineae bacterium]
MLVATDVAARGLDIDHIPHVFNFDLPKGTPGNLCPPRIWPHQPRPRQDQHRHLPPVTPTRTLARGPRRKLRKQRISSP